MTIVVHETPGALPLDALLIFGASAKPATTSPIGYFGTGLKYAVAVLLRHEIPIHVFVGATEYEFYLRPIQLRGSDFQQVMMRQRRSLLARWSARALPFTTQLGRSWRLWMAYRELHANTLDERGETTAAPNPKLSGADNCTRIVVGPSDEYLECHAKRDDVFLPHRAGVAWDGRTTAVYDSQPSDHLYWRGLRVMDLPRPALYRWCVLAPLDLTEDRTVKYDFYAHAAVAHAVATSDDARLVQAVIAAPEKSWEHGIDWQMAGVAPHSLFMDILRKRRQRGSYVAAGAGAYYDRYAPQPDAGDAPDWTARVPPLIRADRWREACTIMENNQMDLADVLEAEAARREGGE